MPIAKSYEELVAGSPQKLKFLSEKNEIFAVICLVSTPVFKKVFLSRINLN